MKILYVCADRGIPVLGAKGASVHVREFANALLDLGHEVHVVCARRGEGNESDRLAITEISTEDDPASIEKEALSRGLRSDIAPSGAVKLLRAELERLAYNRMLSRSLGQIIERETPDVVYERYSLFADAGANVTQQYRLPHLLEVNAPLIEERRSTRGLILSDVAQGCEDRVLRHADRVLVVSSTLCGYVLERGVPHNRVTLVPNGVDTAKFSPELGGQSRTAEMLQSLGLPPEFSERIIVGFVGSLKPWHGVDMLIDSIAGARKFDPRLALLVVGEGPQFEPLKTRAEALNLARHVHFTGAVPHRRVPEYIGAMDIAVAPYRRQGRFYFSPLKILEYMAMAKPVVASRQGQIGELIESGENGILCEPDDSAQFAESIIRLASDALLCRRLGHNAARTVAARASWQVVAERVASVARSVIGPPSLKFIIMQRVSGDPGRRGDS